MASFPVQNPAVPQSYSASGPQPTTDTAYNATAQVYYTQSQTLKGPHLVAVRRNSARHVVPTVPLDGGPFTGFTQR